MHKLNYSAILKAEKQNKKEFLFCKKHSEKASSKKFIICFLTMHQRFSVTKTINKSEKKNLNEIPNKKRTIKKL